MPNHKPCQNINLCDFEFEVLARYLFGIQNYISLSIIIISDNAASIPCHLALTFHFCILLWFQGLQWVQIFNHACLYLSIILFMKQSVYICIAWRWKWEKSFAIKEGCFVKFLLIHVWVFVHLCMWVSSTLQVVGTGQLKDKACNMKRSYYNLQLYLYEITHRF